MAKNELKIPEFESEAAEAAWWYEYRATVEENLIAAMEDGTAETGMAVRLSDAARRGGILRSLRRSPMVGAELDVSRSREDSRLIDL
jgi:hypothetical protein